MPQLDIRIQQILPLSVCLKATPCHRSQINIALKEPNRREDRFSWPTIARRAAQYEPSREVEPGENTTVDFEFAVSSRYDLIRVYTVMLNEAKRDTEAPLSWSVSSLYTLRSAGLD